MESILSNVKDISLILGFIVIISVFISSMYINLLVDSMKGISKNYNKELTGEVIFTIILGSFLGIIIYGLFSTIEPLNTFIKGIIKEPDEFIFNFFRYYSIIVALVGLIFSKIYRKRINKIIESREGSNFFKNNYYAIITVLFLLFTGVIYFYYIYQIFKTEDYIDLFFFGISYVVVIYCSGVLFGFAHLGKVKKYRIYTSKCEEYFKEIIKENQKYIQAYLVTDDNDEYIIKPENQPAIRIKKSLVGMVQPMVDDTVNKKDKKKRGRKDEDKEITIEENDIAKEEVAVSSESVIVDRTDKIIPNK